MNHKGIQCDVDEGFAKVLGARAPENIVAKNARLELFESFKQTRVWDASG